MPPKPLLKKLPMAGAKTPSSSPSSTPRSSTGGPPVKGGPLVGMKKMPQGAVKAPVMKAPMKSAPGTPTAKTPTKAPMLKSPGGPPGAAKAPTKAPIKLKTPGQSPSGTAPPTPTGGKKIALKLPVKAPSGTATPKSDGSATPALKAPMKLPMKKIPIPAKAATPPPAADEDGAATGEEAATEEAPEALDTARTEMGGTRDPVSDSPVPTPREPVPGVPGGHDATPAPTPLPTPRGESSVPPPPPSEPATPRPAADGSVVRPGSTSPPPYGGGGDHHLVASPNPPPPPPRTINDILGPPPADNGAPNFDASPPGAYSGGNVPPRTDEGERQAALIRGLSEGSWPAHQPHYNRPPPTDTQKELEESRTQARQLERKLLESERYNRSQEEELRRLRETLYEREGVKVVQHMAELERENARLRQQMQREKESTLYHQGAHLSAMDELIALRNSVSKVGDYEKLRVEYERLTEQVTSLIRNNTELSLRLADVSDSNNANNIINEVNGSNVMLQSQNNQGGAASGAVMHDHSSPYRSDRNLLGTSSKVAQLPTFVTVRRGALCSHCARNVEIWEERLLRRNAEAHSVPSPAAHPYGTDRTMQQQPANSWRELRLPNGQTVFHNPVTNQSQWQHPADNNDNGRGIHQSSPLEQRSQMTPPPNVSSYGSASAIVNPPGGMSSLTPPHPGARITVRSSPSAGGGGFVYSEGSSLPARGTSLAYDGGSSGPPSVSNPHPASMASPPPRDAMGSWRP